MNAGILSVALHVHSHFRWRDGDGELRGQRPHFFTDDNSGSSSFQSSFQPKLDHDALSGCPWRGIARVFGFSLETGVAASDNDILYIYDGDNTSALPVGTGEDTSLDNVTITASDVNPTGCITVEFVVNSGVAGNQGWVAQVTCETPCAYPDAVVATVSPGALPGDPHCGVVH